MIELLVAMSSHGPIVRRRGEGAPSGITPTTTSGVPGHTRGGRSLTPSPHRSTTRSTPKRITSRSSRRQPWGLLDDPELVAAAVAATDEARTDPPLLASFLALVDDTASRIIDHPIRPRLKVTAQGLLRGELDVVKVEVPAVLAAGLVLDRVVIRAEQVRVVPGLPPRLQAGPVGLRAYVSQDNVDRWTRTARLPMRLALTEEGVQLTTGLRGHPDERDPRRPRGGRPLPAAGAEAHDHRRVPRADGPVLPRLPAAPAAARRARGSPSCSPATASWRSPSSSTTSTSRSPPTSPVASAPSRASRSPACR